jgi:hypothetical protein
MVIRIGILRFDESVSYCVASCSKQGSLVRGYWPPHRQEGHSGWVNGAYVYAPPADGRVVLFSCRSFFSPSLHPQPFAICNFRGSGSPSLLNIQSEAGSSNCLWSLFSSHLVLISCRSRFFAQHRYFCGTAVIR